MTVRWWWEDDLLHFSLDAPTEGWVAVGLNGGSTLEGSLLLLCAVRERRAMCEEHIARPPRHPTRESLGGTPRLVSWSGGEARGRTCIHVVTRVNGDAVFPGARRGQAVYLTLAYSESDDFDHHSRMRSAVDAVL